VRIKTSVSQRDASRFRIEEAWVGDNSDNRSASPVWALVKTREVDFLKKGSARQAEAQPESRALGRPGLARSPSDPPTHAEPTTGSAQPRQGASDLARSAPTQNQRPPPSDPEVPAQRRPRICLLLSSRRLRLSPASTANSFLPAHSLKKRIKKASLSSCLALGISRAYSYRLFKAKEGGYGLGEGMGDEDV
jgi:hypothetical protein